MAYKYTIINTTFLFIHDLFQYCQGNVHYCYLLKYVSSHWVCAHVWKKYFKGIFKTVDIV